MRCFCWSFQLQKQFGWQERREALRLNIRLPDVKIIMKEA